MNVDDQNKLFNIFIVQLKLNMYFYNKNNENKQENMSFDPIILNSTNKTLETFFETFKEYKLSPLNLTKYLLFYFSFQLENSWYNKPKILRFIRRLYFFETGYRCSIKNLSNCDIKNIYSHALINTILRIIKLENEHNKDFSNCLHPFLRNLKNNLLKYKNLNLLSKNDFSNFIFNFFYELISSQFLKDNHIFLKEYELPINSIIEQNLKNNFKDNKNKTQIFLINFFVTDFICFLKKKETSKFLNYNKKIFNIKKEPHSFFLITKEKK